MSAPPPVWPPPPDTPAGGSGPRRRFPLVTALGVGSLAGSCLLPPILWILALMAYGRGHTALFAGIGGLLAVSVLGSGPAAWVLGNRALAAGSAAPQQEGQIKSGRLCGIVGTGFSVLAVLAVSAFWAAARVKSP